jgi:sarcosine/dimethylglycine N-methyltransferase
MAGHSSEAARKAETYYDGDAADNFYFAIWGGEDIHIGVYAGPDEPIAGASRRTVERMIGVSKRLEAQARVLDLGAGYGGSARQLARRLGCRVECLNVSRTQNARNEELNRAQELEDRVSVTHGSFEDLPLEDASYDVVWSQDAFLHSGRREKVMSEAARVLAPGGELIFTDIMQTASCPPAVLQPILDRIELETLGSVAFYREVAARLGLEDGGFVDLSAQLPVHYSRVLAQLESRDDEMTKVSGRDYVERMKKGLRHWIDAGEAGYLAWGILRFGRPA